MLKHANKYSVLTHRPRFLHTTVVALGIWLHLSFYGRRRGSLPLRAALLAAGAGMRPSALSVSTILAG